MFLSTAIFLSLAKLARNLAIASPWYAIALVMTSTLALGENGSTTRVSEVFIAHSLINAACPSRLSGHLNVKPLSRSCALLKRLLPIEAGAGPSGGVGPPTSFASASYNTRIGKGVLSVTK
jgi:hypothetical protein